MTIETSVCAKYKNIDGWHIFESDEMPGLYVASMDAERSYNDVCVVIAGLMRLDHGIDCKVKPELPFREFLASIVKDQPKEQTSLVMSDRRFVLQGVAA